MCCCVDNMATRKQLVEDCGDKQYVYDSRMAALVCSIKTISDEPSYDHYMEQLFTDDEMIQETCTAKTTLFCANICAGLMVNQLVRESKGKTLQHDFTLDLQTMAYFCNTGGDTVPETKTFYETFKGGQVDNVTMDEIDKLVLNDRPPKVVKIPTTTT